MNVLINIFNKLNIKNNDEIYIIKIQRRYRKYRIYNCTKNKLLKHLNNIKIDHLKEICNEINLKHACIYCKLNNLSGQVSGILIENYIKYKYNMVKISSSLCSGDLLKNNIKIELKFSNGGIENYKFNYVQIRINHNYDFIILIAYYLHNDNINNLGNLYIFKLNKINLKDIILKYGHYAHGTKKNLGEITKLSLEENNNNEYVIRPKYNDKCWNELLNFQIHDIII
jgi:hypothetical protein